MISFNKNSIPITTLPNIWHLLISILVQRSSGRLWCNLGQKASFSRGSSWNISEAVRYLLQSKKKTKGIVFLPDYFCNQALMPLRLQQVQLVFYPITENLNPDWSLMSDLVSVYGCPDIFILVHYFGFLGEISKALQFCQQVGTELLEDSAHVLIPFGEIGKHSWATVFSPYKLLPVPKIGILVTSEKTGIIREISSKKIRFDADIYTWMVKRLVQSFLTYYKIPWRIRKVVPFELDDGVRLEENSSVSTWSLQLLKILESELEHYRTVRRKHYRIIEEQILSINLNIARPFFPFLPEDACPYLFPIRLHENIIESVYYRLNENGIPAQTWPDLPPEVKKAPLKHNTAIKLRRSILTLPVHQNLTRDQVEFMAQSLRKAILSAD